jgi:hypothetical protein
MSNFELHFYPEIFFLEYIYILSALQLQLQF